MAVDTYNSFIDNITDNFATPHQQIQRFEEGFYDELAPYASGNEDWSIMWLVPVGVTHLENSVDSYSIRVYFLDLLEKDESNERDVISDQQSIARDFTNWLRENEDNGFNLLNLPVCTPIKSVIKDFTAGWYVDMEIEVKTEGSDCTIPFDAGVSPVGPLICPDGTVFNSSGSYVASVESDGELELPDTPISSSAGNFTDTTPSVLDGYTIADVDWTDSDGTPMTSEYGDTITCTPASVLEISLAVSDDTPDLGVEMTLTITNVIGAADLFSIDWGDGSIDRTADMAPGHTYTSTGSKTISVIATDGTASAPPEEVIVTVQGYDRGNRLLTDGSNDYCGMSTITTVNKELTFAFWFNSSTSNPGSNFQKGILGCGNTGTKNGMKLSTTGKLLFSRDLNVAANLAYSSTTINDGVNHLIVYCKVFNGTSYDLMVYIDNVLDINVPSFSFHTSTANPTIRLARGANFEINAYFDDFSLWLNTALTVSQINTLWNGGLGNDPSAIGTPEFAFKMNESAGTTSGFLADATGNHNGEFAMNNFTLPFGIVTY